MTCAGRRSARDAAVAAAGALLGCLGLALLVGACSGSGASDGPAELDVPEGMEEVEVLAFGVLSPYLADSPLVLRPGISVQFVAVGAFDAWWDATVVGAYGGADYEHVGPWQAALKSVDRPRPGPQFPTDQDGAGRAPVASGDYVVCVDFGHPLWTPQRDTAFPARNMIAGCDRVTVSGDTTVYVFFDEGRAFIDTGDGPAADAYRRLSCHQQRRLGQRPDDLVHLGGDRHRCPNQ